MQKNNYFDCEQIKVDNIYIDRKKLKNIIKKLSVINPKLCNDVSVAELKKKLLEILKYYDIIDYTELSPIQAGKNLISFIECLSFEATCLSSYAPLDESNKSSIECDIESSKRIKTRFLIMRKAFFVKNERLAKRRFKQACPSEADGIYGIANYSLVVLAHHNADIDYCDSRENNTLKYSVYKTLIALYNSLCWQVQCYYRNYQKNSRELYYEFIRCICNLLLSILRSPIYEAAV